MFLMIKFLYICEIIKNIQIMKKILLALYLCCFSASLSAQTIDEPEFVGETILVKQDNTSFPLEKTLAQNRTVASTGLILSGIGKVRSQIQIDNCCASLKVSKNEPIKLITTNRLNF